MIIKRIALMLWSIVELTAIAVAQPVNGLTVDEDGVQFLVVGDWGRNGEENQRDVAAVMSRVAKQVDADIIISTGDNFYPVGVASPFDPQWKSSFEDIYSAHALHVPWLVTLGNHDYHGNVDAQINYTNISRRWHMPARYYTYRVHDDDASVLFIVIDTNPFQTDYRKDTTGEYGDLMQQDTARQLMWLDSVLRTSNDKWKIVVGHHPMYTGGKRKGKTQDMINIFKPLLEKYKVTCYFAGHEHDLQVHDDGKGPLYFVSGAGSEVRPTGLLPNTKFAESKAGFMVVSVTPSVLRLNVVDATGAVLYTTEKK